MTENCDTKCDHRPRRVPGLPQTERRLAVEMFAQQLSGAVQSLAIWWQEHPKVKRAFVVDCVMDFAWLGLERVRAGERVER